MSWNWEPQQRLQVVRQVADTRGSLHDIHGDKVSDVTSVRVGRGVVVAGFVGDAVGRNVAVAPNDQHRRGAVTVVGDGLTDTLRDAATRESDGVGVGLDR
jgi:hypothetical protein